MKVLFVCHRFPYPPNEGGKIRAFHIIKHLASRHEVTVASICRTQKEREAARGIEPFCHEYYAAEVSESAQLVRMAMRGLTLTPFSMGYFHSPDLARWIDEKLRRKRFDLIFVHSSSAAQYVEAAQGIPKIMDFCDMDSQKWLEYARHRRFPLTLGYWLEGVKLARDERRLGRVFDLSTVATQGEMETLRAFGLEAKADWFPNGVDADYFSPGAEEVDPDLLSFIGRMDYYPNQECMVEFCRGALPLLRQRRPGVKLVIVGANPPKAVQDLAAISGVEVTGSVPDVRPYVRRSAVMVAPLAIARGTQNKILEAMAMGVPVVTTSIGARGVDAVPGEHLLVADGHAATAEALLRLLDDGTERRRLAIAGRARVQTNHDWQSAMQRLDRIMAERLGAGLAERAA